MKERMAPMQIDFRLPDKFRNPTYAATPWSEYLKMFEVYAARYGKDQSAERICERGGLGVREVVGMGILEINLYLSWADHYPKKEREWTHLHLRFEDVKKPYYWRKIEYDNGWVEGDRLILPRECLVRLQKYYEGNKDDEKSIAKLELINELIEFIDSRKEE